MSAASAQTPVAVGSEFQINTYTTGEQSTPSVAIAPDGGFVVVWKSDGSSGGDSSYFSVQGRRLDAGGAPVGDQFQLNTYTSGIQNIPKVAVGEAGDFVVVWGSDGSDGDDTSGFSIQGQRFDAGGAPSGGQFQVNTYTTSDQVRPSVAVGAEGGFFVVWESDGSDNGDSIGSSIQGQRYDAAGDPLGGQFLVNFFTSYSQRNPAVATDPDGRFVVVWSNNVGNVVGRRFDSSGDPVGDDFGVYGSDDGFQVRPQVAAGPEGGFVVTWDGADYANGDTSGRSVQGRRYDANGDPAGDEPFRINSYTPDHQLRASLATDASGDFVVVWQSASSAGGDTSDSSIQGRRFASSGTPLGQEFQINTYTTGAQEFASVAANAAGDFLVVWQSEGSAEGDSSGSIQGQRFRVTPEVGDRVWVDEDADGVQDVGEPGAEGVVVRLYDSLGDLVAEAVTDVDGLYRFMTDEGAYYLELACDESSFTVVDACADDADSDVFPDGTTVTFGLAGGDSDTSRDAGLLDPDADGVACSDNCPQVANADQEDADADGVGDACDLCWGDDASGDGDGDGDCADLDPDDGDPNVTFRAVFSDGFESGDTSAWSSTVP